MNSLLDFLILGLASYNLASLLTIEDGFTIRGKPIFSWMRELAGVRYNEHSEMYGETDLAKLFSCIKCMSRWTSLVLVLLYFGVGSGVVWVCYPFALSTIVMVIHDKSQNS